MRAQGVPGNWVAKARRHPAADPSAVAQPGSVCLERSRRRVEELRRELSFCPGLQSFIVAEKAATEAHEGNPFTEEKMMAAKRARRRSGHDR